MYSISKNGNKSFSAGKKANCKKKAVKTCCHGNVNIDEHITTTLKYSQIILRRNHQDLVVIHVA